MSGDSSEEKTEKPSAKKLRDARDKGQVAKSTDLSGSLALLAGILTLLGLAPWSARQISLFFLAVERAVVFVDAAVLKGMLFEALKLAAQLSLAPLAVAALVFTLSLWLQTGTVFSLDTVSPKLNRLDPVAGFKKIASMKTLVQFLQMLLKAAIVAGAVWLVCVKLVPDAIRVIYADSGAAVTMAHTALLHLLLWCGGFFVLLGVADLAFQRWQFEKEQRMSMTELKREHKEQQGDGHIKAERRRAANEPSREEQLQYMSMASLLLQHVDGRLVVLIHRPAHHPLPLYLLRAKEAYAQQVLGIATKQQLKQRRDDHLVELLYPGVQIGLPLQPELAEMVMAHLRKPGP